MGLASIRHQIMYTNPTPEGWSAIGNSLCHITRKFVDEYPNVFSDAERKYMYELADGLNQKDWRIMRQGIQKLEMHLMDKQRDLITTLSFLGDLSILMSDAINPGSRIPTSSPLTRGQWSNGPFIMDWCATIKDDDEAFIASTSKDGWNPDAYDNIRLDFSTPEGTPDGEHRVYSKGWDGEGIGEGVVVQDGQFEPISTERAVLDAVARSYGADPDDIRVGYKELHHIFIEGFKWDADRQMLEVHMGS